MGSEQLAQNGGPREIHAPFPSTAFRLKVGIQTSLDLLKMFSLTLRGYTTQQVEGGATGRFENEFREFTGAVHALATNSGTAALHSAYFAAGVGPGTEVIVPAYTWHASAAPILALGAVPVFCEIDPVTLTPDPEDVERRITNRTRAICVLHAWGNPAPMERFVELAASRSIALIEDCSHAHGARYRGRAVGTWGDFGCYSLGGAKPVNGGEAGIVITDRAEYFDRMLLLAHNARIPAGQRAESFEYGDVSLGLKYRPHVAAMCLASGSLRRLPKRNTQATRTWRILCEELEGVRGIRTVPTQEGGERGGFYFFVLEYEGAALGGPDAAAFVAAAEAEGVPIQLDEYRDCLLHQLPLFTTLDRRKLGGCFYDPSRPWEETVMPTSLPVTERVSQNLVRLQTALWGASDAYVRSCARAIVKVLKALIP